MKELQERIVKDGYVLEGDILKVDSFLNHQMDVQLLDHVGKEFVRLFQDAGVTKVLTIEASGIAVACMTAINFQVPALFAKKNRSSNIGNDVYTSMVHSYTYDTDYPITVSKKYLTAEDKVLIVDDFLANGQAVEGLLALCRQAGCEVVGVGICIEKGFQKGGQTLRAQGIHLESLAIIDAMNAQEIVFRGE